MPYKTPELAVSSSVVKWAISTAGYNPYDVAERLDISRELIQAWEKEEHIHFRVAQLEDLAHFLKRPLATFLLEKPPLEPAPPKDFRRAAGKSRPLSPDLRVVIRRSRRLQRVASELMESMGMSITSEIPTAELRDEPKLVGKELRIAHRAEVILRSCAKIGIITLIDEATGYQEVREKQALQLKLQAFIAEEMQEWARLFPEEFWVQLARLESIHYSPRNRPLRWGRYVMAFVYDAVDKDVANELRKKNPNPHFKQNLHQWLKGYGREKMRDHLHEVLGVMKTCHDMADFRRKFGYVFKKSPLQLTFFDMIDTLASRN